MTPGELYGEFKCENEQWKDGILTAEIRKAVIKSFFFNFNSLSIFKKKILNHNLIFYIKSLDR